MSRLQSMDRSERTVPSDASASGVIPLSLLAFLLVPAHADDRLSASLSASLSPEGRVTLEWSLPEGAVASQAFLYRSHLDLAGMKALDRTASPITRFDLGAGTSSGRFADSLLADGQAYTYSLRVKDAAGLDHTAPMARVETPTRHLPPGACNTAGTEGGDGGCALWVDKVRYVIEVRRGGRSLKRYPIALGADPVDRKLHQDNSTTPEGSYRIAYLKPQSRFHKAYGIDYPNSEDRARYDKAKARGALPREDGALPGIGGSVQIHGGGTSANWTWGCMAMDNDAIDELFAQGGLKAGTPIRISGAEVKRESFAAAERLRGAVASARPRRPPADPVAQGKEVP